jgi:hypothetical protein
VREFISCINTKQDCSSLRSEIQSCTVDTVTKTRRDWAIVKDVTKMSIALDEQRHACTSALSECFAMEFYLGAVYFCSRIPYGVIGGLANA